MCRDGEVSQTPRGGDFAGAVESRWWRLLRCPPERDQETRLSYYPEAPWGAQYGEANSLVKRPKGHNPVKSLLSISGVFLENLPQKDDTGVGRWTSLILKIVYNNFKEFECPPNWLVTCVFWAAAGRKTQTCNFTVSKHFKFHTQLMLSLILWWESSVKQQPERLMCSWFLKKFCLQYPKGFCTTVSLF